MCLCTLALATLSGQDILQSTDPVSGQPLVTRFHTVQLAVHTLPLIPSLGPRLCRIQVLFHFLLEPQAFKLHLLQVLASPACPLLFDSKGGGVGAGAMG